MGKQDWLNLYTVNFAWDESALSAGITQLAGKIDEDPVAHCLSGSNHWGSHTMIIAGAPQYIVNAIRLMNISVMPSHREQLERGLANKDSCPTRWVIKMLIRLFEFKASPESTKYQAISPATFATFPKCRSEVLSNDLVGSKPAYATNGVDLISSVPSVMKMFPYDFVSSLPAVSDILPPESTIYSASNVVQPRFIAFYGGCRATEINTTSVYIEEQ